MRLPSRLRSPGAVFLVAILLFGAAFVTNVLLFQAATRGGYDYGGFRAGPERATFSMKLVAGPGDRIVVPAELSGLFDPAFSSYSVYVTPNGGGADLAEGREPSAVYAKATDLVPGRCCSVPALVLNRPADVPPGPASRHPFDHPIGSPYRVDVTWVFAYAPDAAPRDAEEQRVIRDHAGPAVTRAIESPLVVEARAVSLQPVFYAVEGAAALVAAAGGLLWVRRLLRAPDPDPAEGEAALVGLLQGAGRYLASLRDLLVAGALVAGLAVALALADWQVALPSDLSRDPAAAGWGTLLQACVWALGLSLVAAWGLALARVQLALRRWRRRMANPPLDL